MRVVYTNEDFPRSFSKSVFLAGPTPRSDDVRSWRPDALKILDAKGFDGVVFVPEYRDGSKYETDEEDRIKWEVGAMNMSDCILFWVPRDLETLPAFTTNHEHGEWFKSGKIVLGAPLDAPKMRYLRLRASEEYVSQAENLEETIDRALEMVGDGAIRFGGEREVPLYIWNTASFQAWHTSQKNAGNRLDGARVRFVHRTGRNKKMIFLWVLHVSVYVVAEERNKTNEFVIARPDISAILLYKRGDDILGSHIVLIKEFRSPASVDGFVHELPGGSSWKAGEDPIEVAASEVREETGFDIDAERLEVRDARQVFATLSSHKAHLFSAEISEEELNWFKQRVGVARGLSEDSERTYIEIKTAEEILSDPAVDWSNIGMILSVLVKSKP